MNSLYHPCRVLDYVRAALVRITSRDIYVLAYPAGLARYVSEIVTTFTDPVLLHPN